MHVYISMFVRKQLFLYMCLLWYQAREQHLLALLMFSCRYLRMSPERVEHLISLVGPFVIKKHCRSRDVISPAERIVLTLQYLATGNSQQSLSFAFRIGRSIVCHIISETCEGIWKALHAIYLKVLIILSNRKQ